MKNIKSLLPTLFEFIYKTFLKGFVFFNLWHWFISPSFNLDDISILNATGIVLLVNYAISRKPKKELKEEGKFLDDLFDRLIDNVNFFLYSAFVLFIGWIVSLFM